MSLQMNNNNEIYPENNEDELNISSIKITQLRQLLERKDNEIRQAAEYGLQLLETNEELQLQLTELNIQNETKQNEMNGELQMYKRYYEQKKIEIEHWKKKYLQVQEIKEEIQQLLSTCSCKTQEKKQINQFIKSLQDEIISLQILLNESKENNKQQSIQLKRYQEIEKTQKHIGILSETKKSHQQIIDFKAENLKFIDEMERLQQQNLILNHKLKEQEEFILSLKSQVQNNQEIIQNKQQETNDKAELLLTYQSKCMRLQRELELLEDVSRMSAAVIDHDPEDDSDDEQLETNNIQGSMESNHSSLKRSESTFDRQPISLQRKKLTRCRSFSFPAEVLDENDGFYDRGEVYNKLSHYFHLTALSIIHENRLHDQCFESSSRYTIDTWYREVVAAGIPFLQWHSWLIQRIGRVAAPKPTYMDYTSEDMNNYENGKRPVRRHTTGKAHISVATAMAFFRKLKHGSD